MARKKGIDDLMEAITFAEAAMGANVKVPTLNGAVTLKVPAGTQGGRTFRIKGKGAPKKSGTGDLLVTVALEVPQKLSREEKKLLDSLEVLVRRIPVFTLRFRKDAGFLDTSIVQLRFDNGALATARRRSIVLPPSCVMPAASTESTIKKIADRGGSAALRVSRSSNDNSLNHVNATRLT